MVKRFLLIFFTIILGSYEFVFAQDPGFTQFYANLMYLNPAFAGSVRCPRLTMGYRNQWPALRSAYVTYNVAYDQHLDALEGGVGLVVLRDVQGDGAITTTNISGMYSYTLNISRTFSVKGGFQVTYHQKKLNWDFIFPDMIHPLYGPIFPTQEVIPTDDISKKGYFDFSAGLVGFTRDYFFGFAVHHLTQPHETFSVNGSSEAVLPRKYTLHFGTTIPIMARGFKKGELSISPNVLFQQQQNFQQLNYGVYINRSSIVGGIWLRQNFRFHYDSFILLIGFVQANIKVAYSYDLTVSKLSNQTLGAHEITYSMQFECRQKKKKFRTISCPSF